MFRDEIAVDEMREQTDANDTRNASSNSERRDILDLARNTHDDEQPDERPSSMYLQQIRKGTRSSLTSYAGSSSDGNTPDPEMENSLAHMSKSRRGSIKRSKRFLPADELNEVHEKVTVTADFSGMFRNKLLTAAVNNADKERKLFKDDTPDSLKMDDTNSTVSSVHTPCSSNMQDVEYSDKENIEETNPSEVHCRPSTFQDKEQLFCMEDKTAKSESYLLDIKQVDSYHERAKSAPVEVASICTQTEWSWIEDMKKYEQMKLEMQFSQKVEDTTFTNEKNKDINHQESNVTPPTVTVKEKKVLNKKMKDDDFEDEFYRPPTVEYSSSSSDEDDVVETLNDGSFLPSIGPPKILQYVKESVNPPFTNEFPDGQEASINEEHSCAYCKAEVLEKIDVAQHVSLAEKAKMECPVYHEHIKQQLAYKEDNSFVKDEMIDVRPHPPFGTKAARKAAKERAAARAREREIERQKVTGTTVNYYAMTRQMKTLTYSLASTKCMDDGWTVRPLSPAGTEDGEHLEPFDIEINSSGAQRREIFMERFYTNGNRLLVLFPDGTGCCYYPSGNPAVIISSTEKGKYSYILLEDTYEHSRQNTGVLGIFDPTGHGSCYFHRTGKLRMVLTPFGGTFFDAKGEKRKKWIWYNITGNYVHAPPFQPITFAWTKELSLRCMGQDYIIITYNHGRHTIRFNVGAKLKPVVKKVKLPTDEENYEIQLREIRKFVNLLIERVQTTLRFPHSTRINKLPMPERRNSKPPRIDSRVIESAGEKTTVIVN